MKRAKGQTSRTVTLPTPTGGWNARDAYDQMGEADAITLINLFPQTTVCTLRGGSALFASTASSAAVSTLAEWNGSSSKILAASGGSIYNITGGGSTSLGSGFASDVWQTINFSGPAGTRLLFFNGTDTPQIYDGSTLAASTIASAGTVGAPTLNPINLLAGTMYAQRLFLIERGTMHVWYAQTGAYQGATLNFLDMGAYATRGGSLAAISMWTRINNLNGQPLQLLVVMTTAGEIFVFYGTDPSNAAYWTIEGQFLVGAPVAGARCLANLGSECIAITQDGFQPMSQYLQDGQLNAQKAALSAKIGNAVSDAVAQTGTAFGWEACLYPMGNRILVNVPQPNATFDQFVMNTITGAWCRYQNWNAFTFLRTAKGLLYFGSASGKVYQAETGTSDAGSNIVFTYKSRFAYPVEGFNCFYKMVRPVLTSATGIAYALGVDVDFADTVPTTPAETLQVPGGTMIWGVSLWGQALWGSAPTVQRAWQGVGAIGYSAAVHMQGGTMSNFQLHSIDVLYEPGGVL